MFTSLIEFLKSAIIEQVIDDPIWASVALVGQVIFGSRFIIQWLASEYKKKSHIPVSFWFLSLAGSLILLSYSVHIKNPIFMLAFSINTLIYLRNLHLIYKHSQSQVVTVIENGRN